MNLTQEQNTIMRIAKEIVEAYSNNREVELVQADFLSLNWKNFFALLKKHKLFLLCYKYIAPYVPADFSDEMKSYYDERIERIDSYIQELKDLIDFAQKHSESLLLVKGLSLSVLIYDDVYTREFNDLDLFICNKYDIASIAQFKKLLMTECSYLHKVGGRNIDFHVNELGIFHEYVLRKQTQEGKHITIELKAASSAIDNSMIKEFLQQKNTQIITIGEAEIITNDVSHTLLHLFSNIYGDTEKRLGVERKNLVRDLVDVSIFISKYKSYINWNEIKELSEHYKISYKVYNVMYRLKCMGFISEILQEYILNMFIPVNVEQYNIDKIGCKVTWKDHDLIDRLFDVKGRIDEYCELQYIKNLSDRNINLKNKIDIVNGSYSRWESVSAKTFRETDVSYAFRLNNADKAIVAAIKIPKDLLNNFPYIICFLFYNGGRPYFMYVEAKTENSYYYISTPADRQSRKRIDELDTNMCRAIDCDKEIIIESSIPLEYIDTPLKKGLICYNVTVQKYLFENIKTIIDVKFCEKGDPEEWFEHMGVIQYE